MGDALEAGSWVTWILSKLCSCSAWNCILRSQDLGTGDGRTGKPHAISPRTVSIARGGLREDSRGPWSQVQPKVPSASCSCESGSGPQAPSRQPPAPLEVFWALWEGLLWTKLAEAREAWVWQGCPWLPGVPHKLPEALPEWPVLLGESPPESVLVPAWLRTTPM